jgi:glycosyl hydrolase family 26
VRSRRLLGLAAITAALIAAGALSVGWHGTRVPEQGLSAGPTFVYWGAHIGSQLTGAQPPWSMAAADAFERLAGKRMSLLSFGVPWVLCRGSSCARQPFPTEAMTDIREHGSIPVIDWASYSYPDVPEQPAFRLSAIVGGKYDTFLRRFAKAAKAWGHPFFLRFDWEMNPRTQWAWSEGANGNAPGEFVSMWRHVHDVFSAAGASNVNWTWCPNRVEGDEISLPSLYPGDGYVDWLCMDGYNWGTNPSHPYGWTAFDTVFGQTYSELQALAPDKPIMIGETASSEDGGPKPAWIADAVGAVASRYPAVKGLVWFEANADGMDWPIETSPAAQAAFARAIAVPVFAGSEFGRLAGPKISPAPVP